MSRATTEMESTVDEPVSQLVLDLDLALAGDELSGAIGLPSPPMAVKIPPVLQHSPQEVMLRSAITQLLQDTAAEEEAFGYLRDVCVTTLVVRHRPQEDPRQMRENSSGSSGHEEGTAACASPRGAEPPRSPQDRLRALVPNVMEKTKSRYGRRAMQAGGDELPRWKKFESEDQQPITDIACIFTGDAVPEGYTKIERSPTGQRADLNKGGGGVFIYLCVNRDRSSSKPPISEILVIFPERGEFIPNDYEVVQRRGAPANLNTGTQGERMHLCYRRSMNSSIVDVSVLFPKKGDKLPYGYLKLERSPDGFCADLNATTGGTEVCLGYKKKLHSLGDLSSHWITTMHGLLGDKNERGETEEQRTPTQPKADEVRDISVVESPTVTSTSIQSGVGGLQTISRELAEFYMYPLLLACYTRHGSVAEVAVQALSQCFDACLFENILQSSKLCRLDVVMEALTSLSHQGVKSRFGLVLPFFRKVVRKHMSGYPAPILHATLKALIFVGDFDASLTKSIEDELVYKIVSRYEAERIEHQTRLSQQHRMSTLRSSQDVASAIVSDLVEDTISGVEIVKSTEKLLGVFKTHPSVQSATFCSELASVLDLSTPSMAQKNAFQLIITLTKSVSRKITQTNDQGSDRDQAAIVNALRALNSALHAAGVNVREHRAFGQMIRRIVFSTVNSTALMWSTSVFRASLTLISTLWNHYRRHVKVEFALLFEHLFLRILRSTSTGAVNNQMDIMDEVMPWFQLPHNVVEMFLNYDMERVQQWKIFEHLCGALCSIAEGNNSSTPTTIEEETDASRTALQTQAMTTILAIARSVMDASGHANLINRDARTRLLSMENGGWEQDEQGDDSETVPPIPLDVPASPSSATGPLSVDAAGSPDLKEKRGPGSRKFNPKFGSINVRMRNEIQQRNQQQLKRAMELASSKSLKKAIEYLVAMNFIKETPREITSFLRIYHDFFEEAEIGDYLGEGDEDFKVQVRLTYVRAISFKGMTLVESLRHFLTNGGFRLPGEAQKIERMVEAFAQCFWEDSPASFSSADTAMIIAYSIIMLNTDLHNPQVKKNKMSRDQFVKNNRGIDNGKDLPRKFLEEVYDDIARNPMHIKGSRFVPKSRESTLSLTDLDIDKFRSSVARSISQSEELMKDLSQSYFTFNFVGVDASISPELIKVLFERVWFYLLALSTSILCDAQSDLTLTMHCLDLLRFCISTCLFLGMSVERRAFCNLLTKVHTMLEDQHVPYIDESDEDRNASSPLVPAVTAEWVENIEAAAASDDPWRVMGDIHMLVDKMKQTIQRRQRSEELHSVIKRINRGGFYLKDTTHFIREGDLTKKCRSRNQTYRFFLFNDQLLYADKGMSGYWNPHNSLRLKLTRVSDVAESVMSKHAFQISNPIKSFTVYADSSHAKIEWMRLIEDAITEATKKVTINARRLSYRTLPSSSTDEGTKTTASPASPSALASTATSAVKNFMRRTTRLASPVSEVGENAVSFSSETISPLVGDIEEVETMSSDTDLDVGLLGLESKRSGSVARDESTNRLEAEAETFSNDGLLCENPDQTQSLLPDAGELREL